MRKTHKFAAAMLVAIIVLIAGAVSEAVDNQPQTTPASGEFSASPARVKQRVCAGQDGTYLELRGLWAGEITSTDPRLTGDLEFTAEPALVNLVTGFGTFQGRFSISDPATGQQKAEGEFHSVVTDTQTGVALNHAFSVGKLMNQGTGPAPTFFSAIKATLDFALNVEGEFGGTHPDMRTPGVIQSGHCDGQFTNVP